MSAPVETLKLLTVMSLQSKQVEKALKYARLGHDLFPDDVEIIELLAVTLLQNRQFDQAQEVIGRATHSTKNINYILSRILLISKHDEAQDTLIKYLQSA